MSQNFKEIFKKLDEKNLKFLINKIIGIDIEKPFENVKKNTLYSTTSR
jgi:hypothetical protein